MTKHSDGYTRQRARREKRDILNALDALGRGDDGPADRIISQRAALTASTAVEAKPFLPEVPSPTLHVTVTDFEGAVFMDGIDGFYAWAGGRIAPIGNLYTKREISDLSLIRAALEIQNEKKRKTTDPADRPALRLVASKSKVLFSRYRPKRPKLTLVIAASTLTDERGEN